LAGSLTYFIYLDRKDLVIKREQILTENRFETILPGMSSDQVISILGITKITHGLARNRGYVWHYRYENTQCKSFVIEFTPEDTVRSAGYRIRSGRSCKYVGMG
jgi:3-phenylpropionate/cinnamic acid dioxygenase small subunit